MDKAGSGVMQGHRKAEQWQSGIGRADEGRSKGRGKGRGKGQ